MGDYSSNVNGEILDMWARSVKIFYRQPTHERRVRAVEWLVQRAGSSSRYYNRKGRLFAQPMIRTQPTPYCYFDQNNVGDYGKII